MKSVNIATLLLSPSRRRRPRAVEEKSRGSEEHSERGSANVCSISLDAVALFTFERIIPAKHFSCRPDDILVPEQMVPSCRYKWPVLASGVLLFIVDLERLSLDESASLLLLMNSRRCRVSMLALVSLTLRTCLGEIWHTYLDAQRHAA